MQKSTPPPPLSTATSLPRTRKLNRKQKKKVVKSNTSLPNSFWLLREAWRHIWQQRRLYGGILLVFLLLHVVLVKGLATEFQLTETSETLEEVAGDSLDVPTKTFALLGTLFGTAGASSGESAGLYQLIIIILFSLVIIWTQRQTFDNRTKVPFADVFYKSMYPLIGFLLVGLVVFIQMIPAIVTFSVVSLVSSESIAVGNVEIGVWFVFLTMGVLLSLYFMSAGLFASYIVTLPNMRPMRALRAARTLVRFRRFTIIRKIIFFPVAFLFILLVIFLPLVLIAPIVAELLFAGIVLVALLLWHSYMYVLYRELL